MPVILQNLLPPLCPIKMNHQALNTKRGEGMFESNKLLCSSWSGSWSGSWVSYVRLALLCLPLNMDVDLWRRRGCIVEERSVEIREVEDGFDDDCVKGGKSLACMLYFAVTSSNITQSRYFRAEGYSTFVRYKSTSDTRALLTLSIIHIPSNTYHSPLV
jgi:hypothetical protein